MNEQKTDWKHVAQELMKRVNFAMNHLKTGESTGLMNMETGEITPWREYLAKGMEMYPGVKVDREMMWLLDLPKAKRKKAIQALKDKRAMEQSK